MNAPPADIIFRMFLRRLLPFSLALVVLALSGCGRPGPAAEARLAQALEALQQGRVDEAMRLLTAIKPGGGWLRSPTWDTPLALRLRAQIVLRTGVREEAVRLLKEYSGRYSGLAPAQYTRGRLDFLSRFGEWQGQPALLYVRGIEAETDTPAVAIREWRTLLRDFPTCMLAPAAQLKLGLLQKRLGNAAWALSELSAVAELPLDAVDPDGNAVAPQALLAMGETQFDLMADRTSARQTLDAVSSKFAGVVLRAGDGTVQYSPAAMAKMQIAAIELASGETSSGITALEELAQWKVPPGYFDEELAGNIRAEARLRLAENCLKLRQFGKAREHLVGVATAVPDELRGPLDGPRRKYGFEAADWLEGKLGVRSSEEGLKGLAEVAGGARSRELWTYCQLKRIKILARVGQRNAAREALAELEKRFPSLEVNPFGDGLTVVPAREARRVLGG